MSGWQDSNLRPHDPQPCTLTGLRHAPKIECAKIGISLKELRQVQIKILEKYI